MLLRVYWPPFGVEALGAEKEGIGDAAGLGGTICSRTGRI